MRKFLKTGHPPTLFSAFLYFGTSFMVWMLLGVLAVYIAEDFSLAPAEKGFLAAVPILGGTLVRIPLGLFVDLIGPKKTGIISQLFLMIPLVGAWLFAKDLPSVLAFGLLLGIAGGSFAVALPLASHCYPPQHQGLVLGIAGAGNSGTVLASLLAPRLAEWIGWRNVFGIVLIPVLVTLILFILLAKERPTQPRAKGWMNYLTLLKEADTFWFCLFYSFTFGGFVGLASFLGIFFHDQYALSKVMAGNFTALCVFAGSFCRPIGGYLADRFGGLQILTYLFVSISLLLLGVSLLPPLALVTLLLFLTLTSLGMGNGAIFQLVPKRFSQEMGVATGIIGAAGGIGGFLLPIFLGSSKQFIGSYGIGFVLFACLGLWLLVTLQVMEPKWKLSWLMERTPA